MQVELMFDEDRLDVCYVPTQNSRCVKSKIKGNNMVQFCKQQKVEENFWWLSKVGNSTLEFFKGRGFGYVSKIK